MHIKPKFQTEFFIPWCDFQTTKVQNRLESTTLLIFSMNENVSEILRFGSLTNSSK